MCGTITRFAVWFCALLVCNLDETHAQASSNSSIFPTSHYVYEYINTPLKWEHASRYCELRFGSLPVLSKVEDKNAILDLLATQGANQQLWINGKLSEVSGGEDLTVRKNSVDKFEILVFLNKTDTKHAKILNVLPPLSAVTICARVQWDNQSSDIATVFSYAIPVFINEFQLRGRIDDAGFIQLALIVHGHHTPYKSVLKSDGLWHHICVTWQKENGAWFIYADGIKVSSGDNCYSSQIIGGNGTFIIGQDQDSLGGTFKQNEAFSGNITFLNIWTHALDANQISAVSMCSFPQQNLFYQWNLTSLEIEPNVQVVELQLNCTGLKISSGKCQTFDAASGFKSQFGCENLLPFFCQLTKDTYLKLNEFQSDSRSLFKTKSEAFSHDTMVIEYMSLSNAKLVPNISEAETILKTVQQVLSIENVTLQPADMLRVIRLLQNIANVEPHINDTQEALENVSRSFIHIAGEVLDQHNAERWTEINEIVQSPMAVVYGVDRLMQNLNKLLSTDQENIIIRSKNIKLEIRQKILTNFTNDIDVYMSDMNNKSTDQIGLPKEAIDRLQQKGLTRATFVNTWYGTLHCLLGNGTLDTNSVIEAVSDEGFKGAGMQIASAVISSTVFQGGQPVSMATKYRLRHRIKAFSSLAVDSVCVFWNFSLRPEKGGSWSTAGCRVIESGLESTACFCNHTTNFALLFQLYEVKRSSYEEAVLMNLTLIGCTISLCALVVTLVLFSVVGVPKSDRTTVHKNLICALVAAEGLLVASDSARTNQVACSIVTAMLHLLFMAAFAWMLVEGILLWSKVVTVNINEEKRMKYYYLIGWGFPVFIVAITLATTGDKYIADNHCWLNIQSEIIWAFVGPVLFTLTINTFVLLRVVMITITSSQRRSMMLASDSSLAQRALCQIWTAIKPVVILLPVLGLTWFCGVLVHFNIVLAYIFVALNSFQGLYIFLVYGVYNSEVRNAIKRMKEKRKALSFTNCTSSRPSSCLTSPKMTTSLNVGKCSVSAPDKDTLKSATNKSASSKGASMIFNRENGAEDVMWISESLVLDKTEIQLTAFRVSGL
ncbi:adhesion G-protein coupled receptor D2 isoform X1 [Chiloscyllium plagiosum]|uniref:adhesion G-protein coupled receptor D2 isoform X1 n=1 Tax=Chiloscyllium plagiosum TaxID=36176 RepID=UPI001CB84302|nr:adhesion G-protein coupled receptor D2 isoform X1 [Chiloscyllium plagiosum]XP_043576092.1 adhesion G-protein coupled receptor D2 isoform X1 [Chiloscyllium plagiosum]XP_043576094.1 adhesion G-protein coupled receptor D2 isoform X1 [Chiloscyllium plagiosum]XP_043576095.1 adhesion G-protein coupled receptor D2 isoform X1 [Chiloscyllium plagiosum]XP_043576096.1 adhesion G-protein coupled receptor D2 isoform X1 [Chiloscyllium plagiosum]